MLTALAAAVLILPTGAAPAPTTGAARPVAATSTPGRTSSYAVAAPSPHVLVVVGGVTLAFCVGCW